MTENVTSVHEFPPYNPFDSFHFMETAKVCKSAPHRKEEEKVIKAGHAMTKRFDTKKRIERERDFVTGGRNFSLI